jgi:hypothetical protein
MQPHALFFDFRISHTTRCTLIEEAIERHKRRFFYRPNQAQGFMTAKRNTMIDLDCKSPVSVPHDRKKSV